MIYPKFIKENDTIGIIAPSGGARDEYKVNRFKNAINRLESLGYKVDASKNIYKNKLGRSAPAITRANEVNEFFQNKDIDLIICASGGDFLVEILPYIDFEIIKNNPKFLCGFSDPTGLLFPITTKLDIATIYGNNLSSLGQESLHKSQEDLLEIIKGNIVSQNSYDKYEIKSFETKTGLENYNLTEDVYYKTLDNKSVKVKGRIIGGCFDVIKEICATKYDGMNEFNERYKNDGIIWYFDNCELSHEDTIRTLFKFNELGYFKYTKCIIFGRFGYEHSNYDYTVESCLKDSVISKLNIPVVYEADVSHASPCLNIINGCIANVEVKDGKCKIDFELK